MAGNGEGSRPGLISVLCPTRRRPHRVMRMVESALDTVGTDNLEFVFYADDDDLSVISLPFPKGVRYSIRLGPRQFQSKNWNSCYEWSSGEILMMAADDLEFRTKGWDERVREAFGEYPDRIVLVHAADKAVDVHPNGSSHCTHPFVHRRWVEALGYMTAPYFEVYWSDRWLQEVADRVRRRVFLRDVLIEHVHHMSGAVASDSTYEGAAQIEKVRNPRDIWERLVGERARDGEKLRQVIESSAG